MSDPASRLTLNEAIAFLSYHGVSNPTNLLRTKLSAGELTAMGYIEHRYTDWGVSHEWSAESEVPAAFWREWHQIANDQISGVACDEQSYGGGWSQCEFWYRKSDGPEEIAEIVFQKVEDVRLHKADLLALLPGASPEIETERQSLPEQTAPASRTEGGARRSGMGMLLRPSH